MMILWRWMKHEYVPLICTNYLIKFTCHAASITNFNTEQDAREAMRVFFSVLTKRICMHKTNFLRIYSNIILKVILNCMNMQIVTQLII